VARAGIDANLLVPDRTCPPQAGREGWMDAVRTESLSPHAPPGADTNGRVTRMGKSRRLRRWRLAPTKQRILALIVVLYLWPMAGLDRLVGPARRGLRNKYRTTTYGPSDWSGIHERMFEGFRARRFDRPSSGKAPHLTVSHESRIITTTFVLVDGRRPRHHDEEV
jgi:hypothetical protein